MNIAGAADALEEMMVNISGLVQSPPTALPLPTTNQQVIKPNHKYKCQHLLPADDRGSHKCESPILGEHRLFSGSASC